MLAGLYVAAGESKPIGERKMDRKLPSGASLGSVGLGVLLAGGCDRIAVAVRFGDPLHWLTDGQRLAAITGKINIVPCPDTATGLSRIVKRGVRALLPDVPDALLIVSADQPFITPALLGQLRAAFAANPGIDYSVCGCGDTLLTPAILSAPMFTALFRFEGEIEAKRLFHNPQFQRTVVRLSTPAPLAGVETEEDLLAADRHSEIYGKIV
ncbi:MAG: NTP transferase domain-containing protein [Paenibacillaceae bacterium]|nr:NTP transferase domain-containing protein [Paenibacillaceae bacterium]